LFHNTVITVYIVDVLPLFVVDSNDSKNSHQITWSLLLSVQ